MKLGGDHLRAASSFSITRLLQPGLSISGLRQRGGVCGAEDDSEPLGSGGLPFIEILSAHNWLVTILSYLMTLQTFDC